MLNQVEEDDELLGAQEEGRPAKASGGLLGSLCACLSVEYYRQYFDVNTEDVLLRLKYALLFCGGASGQSPFLDVVREKPDAYGPWWISTTLIFLMSVTSQVTGMLSGTSFNFEVVTWAAMTVYSYVGVLAVALWLALNYWLKAPLSLLQCACVVGYSLTVYLPATLLCVLFGFLSYWPPLLAAGLLSSLFIAKALFPLVQHHDNKQLALFAAAGLAVNAVFVFVVEYSVYSAS